MKEMAEWLKTYSPMPEWFTVGSTAPKAHIVNVRRGLHPFGLRLTNTEGATCGNCRFHVTHSQSSAWHKCSLMNMTHGPGTDLRVKWRGCEKWDEEVSGAVAHGD